MKEFLAIDLGGGTLKLGLFDPQTDGTLVLKQFAVEPLGIAGLEEGTREDLLKDQLKSVMERLEIRGKGIDVNFCSPSYQAFSKVFPTPPVEGAKIKQLIEYEAQQNVPFPLDEVIWDYQVLGTKDTGELEVMLLALKTEVVEAYNRVASANGLRVNIVDGAVSALRNAFVHNYGDHLEGCTLLLDIGCRTTNIIFIEDNKFYARSVQVGGNSITQEFSKESGMGFDEAEAFKINYGQVHLGEHYQEPEHVHVALVAKQARQVFTRLHQQVMQTVQHYRSQMNGSPPVRVFLAGAGSTLAYTSNFFEEKLNAPVNYFDPFRNIVKGPEINEAVLAQKQHMLGEVAGLGLRNVMEGMTEFNLTPMSEQVSRIIDRKSPYIIAAVYVLGMIFMVHGFYNGKLASTKDETMKGVQVDASPFRARRSTLTTEMKDLALSREEADKLKRIFQSRYQWMELFTSLQRAFDEIEKKPWSPRPINANDNPPKVDVAIWVRGLKPHTPGLLPGTGGGGNSGGMGLGGGGSGMDSGGGAMQRNGGGGGAGGPSPFGPQQTTNNIPEGPTEIPAVTHLLLKLQARNLSGSGSSANSEFANYVQDSLRANTNLFVAEGTMLTNKIEQVGSTNISYNFEVVLQLKFPLIQKDLSLMPGEFGEGEGAATGGGAAGPSF